MSTTATCRMRMQISADRIQDRRYWTRALSTRVASTSSLATTNMSRPTSSKTVFSLTKYSRAIFGNPESPQGGQIPRGDFDWHHHTQPTIRLLLETRKSPEGVPEQMRLRVVWSVSNSRHVPAASNIRTNHQQENVIFVRPLVRVVSVR